MASLAQAWTAQGSDPTTISATDSIAFSDGTFGNAITVGEYQDGTHVRLSGGTEKEAANNPHNTKYLTSSTMSLNGAASANLSTLTTGNSPLKINVTHDNSVAISAIKLYAYDGTTTTDEPTDTTVYVAEQGDSDWTATAGSGTALTVTNSDAATSHDFFFAISVKPDAVGVKSANKLRWEFTYQ